MRGPCNKCQCLTCVGTTCICGDCDNNKITCGEQKGKLHSQKCPKNLDKL